MKKKIEVEIPEGKKVEWVDGVLTLVDEKPQDIKERVKTFDDAVAILGNDNQAVIDYYAIADKTCTEDILAFAKLRVIAEALNEGWEPTFDKDEKRWYPWFTVKQGGLVFSHAVYAGSYSYSSNGVWLAFKSKELAEYAGKQFIDIYKDFCYERNKL